jgi:hypothetical protein
MKFGTRFFKVGILCLIVSIAFVSGNAQIGNKGGSTPEPDKRVKKLLDEKDFKYTVSSAGNYQVICKFDDGRTQLVTIRTKTYTLHHMEIREVDSKGYQVDEEIPTEVLLSALKKNAGVKLGAFQLIESGDTKALLFNAQIAADTDAETLYRTIFAVAKSADEFEQEWVTGDDY